MSQVLNRKLFMVNENSLGKITWYIEGSLKFLKKKKNLDKQT